MKITVHINSTLIWLIESFPPNDLSLCNALCSITAFPVGLSNSCRTLASWSIMLSSFSGGPFWARTAACCIHSTAWERSWKGKKSFFMSWANKKSKNVFTPYCSFMERFFLTYGCLKTSLKFSSLVEFPIKESLFWGKYVSTIGDQEGEHATTFCCAHCAYFAKISTQLHAALRRSQP